MLQNKPNRTHVYMYTDRSVNSQFFLHKICFETYPFLFAMDGHISLKF